MPIIHQLKSPPITEAIVDIRVKANPSFNFEKFNDLKSELNSLFPIVEQLQGGQITLKIQPGELKAPQVETMGLQGYLFKTEDKTTIAQFRIDGFTLNKLKPYTSWEDLNELATKLWEKYKSIAKPEAITRIALRYINRINIAGPQIDFDDYLTAGPQVPEGLSQAVSGFLHKTTIHEPENDNYVHVTQALETSSSIADITIILDIDAFKVFGISPDDPFKHFSNLRELKNKVFFNFLTEKTIGLFE